MLAAVVAVAGTIPVLAAQIWLFVRLALKEKERKVTQTYIPALFVCFYFMKSVSIYQSLFIGKN